MRHNYYRVVLFSAVCLLQGLVLDRASAASTLIIVPARPRVLQWAFDMQELRSVEVLSYRGDARAAEPLLHLWTGSEWRYISLPDFNENRFLARPVERVVLVGDDQTVPPVLIQGLAWCPAVERLPTLNIAALVNEADRLLQFKEREWKWLAKRYDLTLIDVNTARRSVNPYAIPRSKLPLETTEFKQEPGDLPPATIVKEQSAAADQSAEQPADKPAEKNADQPADKSAKPEAEKSGAATADPGADKAAGAAPAK